MKTNKMYLLLCGVLFLSSCWKIESDTCHKRVRFINNADFPIRVYQMWKFNSFVDCYAFGIDVDKSTLYPSDTAKLKMADDWECLESLMEYYQAHPEYPDASWFRGIYICDTARPEQKFYLTEDSVLMQYNILKEINLLDSNISDLQKRDFIIRFP